MYFPCLQHSSTTLNSGEPTGKYSFGDVKHLQMPTFKFDKNQKDKAVFFDFDTFWLNEELKKPIYEWIPTSFIEAGFNRHYFDGQLLRRLKFTHEFQDYVEEAKQRIGYKHPIISLHIRRGDKYQEAPYVPLALYRNAIKTMSEATGIRKVFVTSDSEDAIHEIQRGIDLEFVWDDEEQRYDNANHTLLKKHHDLAIQETFTAVKILELLASADKIVGPDNAHLTNLAVALNSARTGNLNNHCLISGDLDYSKLSLLYWPILTKEILRQYIKKNKMKSFVRALHRLKNYLT